MLRIYWNELKKLKRQKMTRTLFMMGFLMPAFCTVLCVHNNFPFRNLVGLNELFGSFLVVPFLFSVQLLSLFTQEEQNHTLKNLLVIGISKNKIFVSKLLVAVTVVLAFVLIETGYSMLGGFFLRGYHVDFIMVFGKLLVTSLAAVCGTMPVVVLIVLLQKKNLIAMIAVNCFIIMDFLLVWQLSMFNCLNLHFPVLVAYRITYPFSIFDYTENLQLGIDTLYYPATQGLLILSLTVIVSLVAGIRIFTRRREL